MLKKLKQTTLRSLKSVGVSTMVHNSRWRGGRLLILAYHGISVLDEHEWNYTQYMSAEVFRLRLQQLKDSRCAVLPLAEAIERLYQNDLPDRAVAITFDDGTADFYHQAFPLIKEFDVPVSLYLTTFYTHFQRPVFDLMVSYLLWKGRERSLDLTRLINADLQLDLRGFQAQDRARVAILEFAHRQELSAEEKDDLAAGLSHSLNVDYDFLLEKRIMQNLAPAEVTEIAAAGIDIQLHTHRHRTPKDRDLFIREIEDNRKSIAALTGKRAVHFCYPSGAYDRAFLPWLTESGVASATTCEPGFASVGANRLLLPRVLDNPALSPIEFESWLTGVSAALPRRRVPAHRVIG
jgi:peptidoglycan/xylan/chitin deacetylase (PgdA/CDA1 family)